MVCVCVGVCMLHGQVHSYTLASYFRYVTCLVYLHVDKYQVARSTRCGSIVSDSGLGRFQDVEVINDDTLCSNCTLTYPAPNYNCLPWVFACGSSLI